MRRILVLVVAALTATLLAGCGDGSVDAADADETAAFSVPRQIAGLRVQPEQIDAEDLEGIDRPYVDNIAVFSLRDDELLRATLQVARFNRVARPDDVEFRETIVSVLGGTKTTKLNVAGETVYSTSATGQDTFAWFSDRGWFVLSIQQDYEFPRTLLRRFIDQDLSV